ncbi:alpha-(1,3)-fucosyltransferase C-like [Rhipicephalus sanguineus]|nr:alpha-(1,3)-fucosyltransferase C-like [Rhipicephalus sanguineus]
MQMTLPTMPIQGKYHLLFMLVAAVLLCYAITRTRRVPELKIFASSFFKPRKHSALRTALRRIMIWTPYFGKWDGALKGKMIGEVLLRNCPAKCVVTRDRRLIEYSDAVVFHVRDLDLANLPPNRTSSQKWVFFFMESPPHTYFNLKVLPPGMFNWTMTYRSDSDVYVPSGSVVPRDANATRPKRDLRALWKSKNKTAVWAVSNCVTSGGRERYVAELRKHMDVDVYGHCGRYKCPKSVENECLAKFEQTYFFMLAFENSICPDYVTEKLFNALLHDIVPVVFGGANYSQMAPNRSYIDALSFESPKHLAEHLLKLSQNYTEYASYFAWKERHNAVGWEGACCDLCKKLHNSVEVERSSSYADIRSWWYEKRGPCRKWDERIVTTVPIKTTG